MDLGKVRELAARIKTGDMEAIEEAAKHANSVWYLDDYGGVKRIKKTVSETPLGGLEPEDLYAAIRFVNARSCEDAEAFAVIADSVIERMLRSGNRQERVELRYLLDKICKILTDYPYSEAYEELGELVDVVSKLDPLDKVDLERMLAEVFGENKDDVAAIFDNLEEQRQSREDFSDDRMVDEGCERLGIQNQKEECSKTSYYITAAARVKEVTDGKIDFPAGLGERYLELAKRVFKLGLKQENADEVALSCNALAFFSGHDVLDVLGEVLDDDTRVNKARLAAGESRIVIHRKMDIRTDEVDLETVERLRTTEAIINAVRTVYTGCDEVVYGSGEKRESVLIAIKQLSAYLEGKIGRDRIVASIGECLERVVFRAITDAVLSVDNGISDSAIDIIQSSDGDKACEALRYTARRTSRMRLKAKISVALERIEQRKSSGFARKRNEPAGPKKKPPLKSVS